LSKTRLRITVSAGEGSLSPDIASCGQPTIAVLASKYKPKSPEKYREGYKAVTSSIRRNSRSPVTFLKSANTIENMLARQEAAIAGTDETLFLNEKGRLTEAAGSNLFIVSNGILLTPRYGDGILPGVTRVIVFELAMQLGIKVRELNLEPSKLSGASEAFVTNSMIEIMPLTEVDGQKIGDGQPGPLTLKLMGAYKKLVKEETA